MSGGRLIPEAFGVEMGDQVGVDAAHPVVGIGAPDTVFGVLVRLLGRSRRSLHSRHRTLTGLVAGLGLIAGALVVQAAVHPAAAKDETTFTVGLVTDVDSFNPFLGVEAPSYEMWALTYDYMVNYAMKDMSPEPGLAKSWTTSDDGLTWTFDIREGVKWSDGKPLTAADIAFTYNRVLAGGLEANNWSSYLNQVTKVTAPDAKTVVLTLSKPNAVLPLLPIPVLPEHIWKSVSEKAMKSYAAEPKDGKPVVGSGRFRLISGTAGGSTYRLKKNPDYWGGPPHVDYLEFRVFKSNDPAVQALIKGEVDFVYDINPLQVRALQGRKNIAAHSGLSPLFEEIGFNTGAVDTKTGKPIGDGNAVMRDPKFRHALGYAIDRDRIVKSAFQGAGEAGSTVVHPAYKDYVWRPSKQDAFTYDPDKAGQLLDDAGYKKGSNGLRTMPDGKPIGSLRLYARSDQKSSIDTMDFFKEWLADVGISAKVTAMDSGKLGDVILSGEFDAFEWDWYVEPDPDGILADFTCGQRGGLSDSWYCDKGYDAMYKAQSVEMDHAKRVEIIKRMQQQLYEDAPYLVTIYAATGEAARIDRFACFQPQPDPGGIWLVQYGAHNYSEVRPAAQSGDCDGVASAVKPASASVGDAADGGSNTIVLVAGGVLLLVLLAGAGLVLVRRRATSGDRE